MMKMSNLQKLPLGLSSFAKIRQEGCLYVDKTEYAYNLITKGYRYFLARPRRFGKSLFVSTLQEILSGEKDLFNNLWIADSDYTWKPHGVIALDFSRLGIKDVDTLINGLLYALSRIARDYELTDPIHPTSPELALSDVVIALHRRFGKVAILIDEYDNPILNLLHEQENAKKIRDSLKYFFAAIKGLDEYVNFVFITGVSSFTRAGLFSGINNLQIITLNDNFSSICGYTDAEIDYYFSSYIQAWADNNKSSYEELRTQIKNWYNGYHFGVNIIPVYNPFSFMHAINIQNFKNFWVQSGTPSFLIEEFKKEYTQQGIAMLSPEKIKTTENILQAFDVGAIPLPALMFQTGYLTITGYDSNNHLYSLGYPNHELKEAFIGLNFKRTPKKFDIEFTSKEINP